MTSILLVEVVPERAKGELPCRVVFTPADGPVEELWRVQFERGVCVAKAARKRALLEADGWRCRSEVTASWAEQQIEAKLAAGDDEVAPAPSRIDEATTRSAEQLIGDDDAVDLERTLATGAPG